MQALSSHPWRQARSTCATWRVPRPETLPAPFIFAHFLPGDRSRDPILAGRSSFHQLRSLLFPILGEMGPWFAEDRPGVPHRGWEERLRPYGCVANTPGWQRPSIGSRDMDEIWEISCLRFRFCRIRAGGRGRKGEARAWVRLGILLRHAVRLDGCETILFSAIRPRPHMSDFDGMVSTVQTQGTCTAQVRSPCSISWTPSTSTSMYAFVFGIPPWQFHASFLVGL